MDPHASNKVHEAPAAKRVAKGITLFLLTGILVLIAAVGGSLWWVAEGQNEEAKRATNTMIDKGLEEWKGVVELIAVDYAWWDLMYNAILENDDAFFDENIYTSVHDVGTADLMVVANPAGDLYRGWMIEDVGVPIEELMNPAVMRDIEEISHTLTFDEPSTSFYLRSGDALFVVGISHVTPSVRPDDLDIATLPLFINGQWVTDEKLDELGESYLIDDMHLILTDALPEGRHADFIELIDPSGTSVGRIAWTAPTPGYTVLNNVAIPIALAITLLAGIALFVASRARSIAQALGVSHQYLRESESELERQLHIIASEKEKNEAILSNLGEGILAVDTEGKVMLCNKAAALLLGRAEDEVIDRPIDEVFSVKARGGKGEISLKGLLSRQSLGEPVRIPEATLVRADGVIIILALAATPIMIEGDMQGSVFVFYDVTERKIVDSAKRQFISVAAHQLRTPLTGVKWSMSMIIDGGMKGMSAEDRNLLTRSFTSVNQMIELVNDLLNLDRIESGRLQFSFHPTNIPELIRNIILELEGESRAKGLDVGITLGGDAVQVIDLDPAAVRIALQNIIQNAVRYSRPDGKVIVHIEPSKDTMVISVTDSGIGIPVSERNSIFTRFFRATNAVQHAPDGSGLGLYLAKRIVERHGGKIWFETAEGKGTVFFVSLPLSPVDHAPQLENELIES